MTKKERYEGIIEYFKSIGVEILPLDYSYVDEYGQTINSEAICPKI